MNGNDQNSLNRKQYLSFLCTVDGIVRERIGNLAEPVREKATEFAQEVFCALNKKDAVNEVVNGLSGQCDSVQKSFTAELGFFNARYNIHERDNSESRSGQVRIVAEWNEKFILRGLEDAGTVKDTLEQILDSKIKGWLKKLLKILNELLRLLKP